ncbi:MAG TPA: TonB-dependent receptor [Candidatus Kapabacteria bacterium]|nr:TonB-dependent receptor [Candidatus Kapabacteria bacterium]
MKFNFYTKLLIIISASLVLTTSSSYTQSNKDKVNAVSKESANTLENTDTNKIKRFDDIIIYGASKRIEKITESPSAISTLDANDIRSAARSNQVGSAFEGVTGIDILRNGTSDFIVNTRGFNNGLNRRLLVLQDGRDLAMPLLGAQEWNTLSLPLDEFARIEFIKGPASALYGANSFNGVMALTSFAPKEVLGTKISLLGGDYQTYRGDIRHAGLISDKLSYKITLGRSGSLNLSKSRIDSSQLEYEGVKLEKRPIYDDERNTYSTYGTVRLDYDFDENSKSTLELGYSDSGNEIFVQALGRVLVTNTQRPYARFAYNSENINFQASYMRRDSRDSMWLLFANRGPGYALGSPLLTDDEDIMLDLQYNNYIDNAKNLNFVVGVSQQFQNINTHNTTLPIPVKADFTGVYAQLSYDLSKSLKFVASGRFDRTNLHSSQFSPRAAIVYSLNNNHKLRLSGSSSFQRPNYSELFRWTYDRSLNPTSQANLANINTVVTDSLKSWTGNQNLANVDLGLSKIIGIAVGNSNLEVEKNLGFELGYQGIIDNSIYITADLYYNKLTDFITNFGPGFDRSIPKWTANLGGDLAQYDQRVSDMVYSKLTGDDKTRLSYYKNEPRLVQSVGNFGEVVQYGLDLSLNWYLSDKMILSGNYSYYNFDMDSKPGDPIISSNTSPNRANIALQYYERNRYDVKLSVQYSDTYKWISGASVGQVPAFTIMNLSAGYYILENLEISTYVFNLLDSKVIQIFGGTYLPRQFNIKATITL